MNKADFPFPTSTLVEMLMARAADCPDQSAFTCIAYDRHGRELQSCLTYRELDQKARALAVHLKKKGLREGERTLIFSTQSLDNIVSIYGTLYAGGVFILNPPPIDPGKQQRFRSVLESARPKFLLCNSAVFEKMQQSFSEKVTESVTGKMPSLLRRFLPSALPEWSVKFIVKAKEGIELVNVDHCKASAEKWVFPAIGAESPATLQYSSGSTAAPKGCTITHHNMLANLVNLLQVSNLRTALTFVNFIPFFHNMGSCVCVFSSTNCSGHSVIMSPLDFLEKPIRWLELITRFKAQVTAAPNSAYQLLARVAREDDLKYLDLSSLRYAINGSEPIPLSSLQSFADKFSVAGFRLSCFKPGYGLSESTSGVFIYSVEENFVAKTIDYHELNNGRFVELPDDSVQGKSIVSCGRVSSSFCRAKIVDPQNHRVLPEGEIGEIWLQGDMVAKGYWKQPEATTETFENRLQGENGNFLRTGDLGTVVDDHLFVTGRIKELIIIKGKNYYPIDIENAIKDLVPELGNCSTASFALVKDGREVPVVVIEIDAELPGFEQTALAVMRSVQQMFQFSPYDVVFVKTGDLPRADIGKIQALKAREMYENHSLPMLYSSRQEPAAEVATRTVRTPTDETEAVILEIIEQKLKPPFAISTDDNFFNVGGDSLAATEIAAALGARFSVEIPLQLFLEEPTIRRLASIIEHVKSRGTTAGFARTAIDLAADCHLDAAIQPEGDVFNFEDRRYHLLLTGATGFLGAYILHYLLETTQAEVYCLVRAADVHAANERIINNMITYNLWKSKDPQRITPVPGNLEKPLAGLSPERFDELSKTIDIVIHNGAQLNFIKPYSSLERANVGGTVEMLRLAAKSRTKIFHYVSSFSVFDNPSHFQKHVTEDDSLDSGIGYFLGYSETKWVSEKLCMEAGNRGVPVTTHRPGEITGDATQGIWFLNDAVSRFLVSCVQLGCVPDLDFKLHLTPVDYVARAIAHLATRPLSNTHPSAFHLINNDLFSIRQICSFMNSYGYKISLQPYQVWKSSLIDVCRNSDENPLKLLLSLFLEERNTGESFDDRYSKYLPTYDVAKTEKALEGAGISCPPVSNELLRTYFDFFRKEGFLPRP